jgi:hypothetical protein
MQRALTAWPCQSRPDIGAGGLRDGSEMAYSRKGRPHIGLEQIIALERKRRTALADKGRAREQPHVTRETRC